METSKNWGDSTHSTHQVLTSALDRIRRRSTIFLFTTITALFLCLAGHAFGATPHCHFRSPSVAAALWNATDSSYSQRRPAKDDANATRNWSIQAALYFRRVAREPQY